MGARPTVELAAAAAEMEVDITIVGIGGGKLPSVFGSPAYDIAVRAPYRGTRSELIEVPDLARRGQVRVQVERFSLDEGPTAYKRLSEGKIRGRAVIVPNG